MPICPYLTIWAYGHMGICEKNMGKWGIPEKSIKNAAQKRWIQVRRTFHSKVTAKNIFTNKIPCILPCKAENISNTISRQVSDLAQMAK